MRGSQQPTIGITRQILGGPSAILCADSNLKGQRSGYRAEKPGWGYMMLGSQQPMIGIARRILGGPSAILCADSTLKGQRPGHRADGPDWE